MLWIWRKESTITNSSSGHQSSLHVSLGEKRFFLQNNMIFLKPPTKLVPTPGGQAKPTILLLLAVGSLMYKNHLPNRRAILDMRRWIRHLSFFLQRRGFPFSISPQSSSSSSFASPSSWLFDRDNDLQISNHTIYIIYKSYRSTRLASGHARYIWTQSTQQNTSLMSSIVADKDASYLPIKILFDKQ